MEITITRERNSPKRRAIAGTARKDRGAKTFVPKIAARARSIGFAVMAKTPPAMAINTVPKIKSVFRP
jgi:hypothetical protein